MFRILPLVLLDDDAFDAYLSDDEDNNNDAQQVIVIEDEGGGGNRCTMDKKPCHTNLNHYLEVLDGIDGHQKKRCRERVTNDNDNYNDNDMNENNVAMENHLRTRRWILIVVSFLPFLFSSITLVVMVLSGGHQRTSMTTKSEMLSTFQFDALGFVHEDIFIPP